MKYLGFGLLGLVSVAAVAIVGCSSSSGSKSDSASAPMDGAAEAAAAGLAKLSPEDRALAQRQRWCVVEQDNLLGAMDAPVKLTIEGKPVFLCCKGCEATAHKDEKATLKKAAELIEINECLPSSRPRIEPPPSVSAFAP